MLEGLYFKSLGPGGDHSCGIGGTTDKQRFLYCWGNNEYGQLGTVGPSTFLPNQVSTLKGWTAVGSGQSHSCGLRRDTPYCWVRGTWDCHSCGHVHVFLAVISVWGKTEESLPNLMCIFLSAQHPHLLHVSHMQGLGSYGQIGNSAFDNVAVPTPVTGTRKYNVLVVGAYHACAIESTGAKATFCW
jgi:hypothetical protein